MEESTLTVSALNEYVRRTLAGDPMLRYVRLRGEISNFKQHFSGHWYFSLKDETECYRFFEDMCTINELQAMAQRWQVARQLDADVTYQDISHKFNASTATISRVNRCLEYGAGGYRLILDRMKETE